MLFKAFTKQLKNIAAASIIFLAFALRISHLNDLIVEKPEMMSIVWFIRRGLVTLLTTNKDLNNHPLNSLLGYLFSFGNETMFTLRWHSVLIGVITVAVVLRLARHWFGPRDSLIAGLLLSLSAYHVNLSQRARGYVGLVGFTALAFYFAWRALQTGKKRYWIGYVLAGVLCIYTHLYGIMAVGTIGLIVLAMLITGKNRAGLWRLVGSSIIILAASALLYFPMRQDTFGVVGQANQFRESDLRQAEDVSPVGNVVQSFFDSVKPFSLAGDSNRLHLDDPTIRYSALRPVALMAQSQTGYVLALVSFLLGVVFSVKKYRRQTLICLAWIAVPFAVQWIGYAVLPGAYFRERFLAFIYIPFFLLMARGWPGLADWLAERLPSRGAKQAAKMIGWLGVGALVILNLGWLSVFSAAMVQEQWPQTAGIIAAGGLTPNDMLYCGQRSNSACSFDLSVRLRRDAKELDDGFADLTEAKSYRAGYTQPGRVWVVLPNLSAAQTEVMQRWRALDPQHYRLSGDPDYSPTGLILVDTETTLYKNLIRALTTNAELSFINTEKFILYLTLAKLNIISGDLAAADQAYKQAQQISLPAKIGWAEEGSQRLALRLNYAHQAEQAARQLPPGTIRLNRDFESIIRLVGYKTGAVQVSPGQTVTVTLFWTPLAPVDTNLVSYVYLVDSQAQLLDRKEGPPGGGQLPTSTWQPGQLVEDTYTLQIGADVPTPLGVTLEAGLFDPQNSRFLVGVDQTGQPSGPALAKISILPAGKTLQNQPQNRFEANFAGKITLSGYTVNPDSSAVTFYWQADTVMAENYTLFVHLLDPADQIAAQMDGQPLGGNYATSWWLPGQTVTDARSLPSLATGTYRIRLGWYRSEDGVRLPLADGSGDSVIVGQITIP